MKKQAVRVFLIIILLTPLSSCVYDKEFAYLNDQIVALNRRVNKIQEATDTKLGRDLEAIRSNQAEFRVEIDGIKGELGGLSGRVEDNERIIKHSVERDLNDQDAIQANLARLSQDLAVMQRMVKRQHEYLGLEMPPVLEDREKEQGEVEQKKTGVDDEITLYDGSLALFHQGRFEEAMDGFRNLLTRFPKSDRADNAQFWIGECYMALNQHEQAILAYQEVIRKYPKGNKVANALLRQAVAFLEIKDKTSSRLLLEKVIKKYPKSQEAEIARKRLETLK